MKYRLVKRTRRWAVQQQVLMPTSTQPSRYWETLSTWRWRFLAALHLLWLRERVRK